MSYELRNVVAGYRGSSVLRDVTLVVPASSVTVLLGANGAGKTTLLRVASGLLRPEAGALVLDDVDVSGTSPARLAERGVCHVPEGRGVFPNLTVRDNLLLYGHGRGEAIDEAVTAFAVLGQRLDQQAGTLSGGEQQMLALARAYIQQPRVVLLDEVSMGLAPKVVEEIFSFFEVLAASGVSLLVVEQYVTRALALADYVYLLQRGEVVFAGEPFELRDDEIFRRYMGVGAA